jgi:hypothetical protein
MVVDATWIPQNYLEAADAAHAIRSWGDAARCSRWAFRRV